MRAHFGDREDRFFAKRACWSACDLSDGFNPKGARYSVRAIRFRYQGLIHAKFVSLGYLSRTGERFKSLPLLQRSISLLALSFVPNALEGVVVGLIHHQTAPDTLPGFGGGTLDQLIAASIVGIRMSIPFFAFRALSEDSEVPALQPITDLVWRHCSNCWRTAGRSTPTSYRQAVSSMRGSDGRDLCISLQQICSFVLSRFKMWQSDNCASSRKDRICARYQNSMGLL